MAGARRTVSTNQLTPNKTVLVRGHLTYSRITSQVAGEELIRDQQRKQQRRLNPIDKPYTTASICDAMVLVGNPNAKTLEEIYIEEHLYQSQTPGNTGWNYSGYNKGSRLPWVATPQSDGSVQQVKTVEGELANGLDVTLVMRVFQSHPNNGVSLDGIIVNEPIRYYNGGIGIGLAEHGIKFRPAEGANNGIPADNSQADAAPAPAGQPNYGGQGQSTGTPVSNPSGNPYTNNQSGQQGASYGGQPQGQQGQSYGQPQGQTQGQSYGQGQTYYNNQGQGQQPAQQTNQNQNGGYGYTGQMGQGGQPTGQDIPFGSAMNPPVGGGAPAGPAGQPYDQNQGQGIRYDATDRQY